MHQHQHRGPTTLGKQNLEKQSHQREQHLGHAGEHRPPLACFGKKASSNFHLEERVDGSTDVGQRMSWMKVQMQMSHRQAAHKGSKTLQLENKITANHA